eukprot:TRINITY_DN5509_c0_g1_i1.p1 TRINITY_DN5509_c0_g1~~TRINITY_DN5509_c0_g1_i1.p1  ORF type:complete len:446 (+),score=114.40 TRINITY_DN5509_c0_g1_i1:15-1352(+)
MEPVLSTVEAVEDDLRNQLEKDGEELLMPVILYDSDSDNEEPRASSVDDEPQEPEEKPTFEQLKTLYSDMLSTMSTVSIHNHCKRELYKDIEGFFKRALSSERIFEHSSDIEKIPITEITEEEFQKKYVVSGGKPVIIKGITEADGWRSNQRWTSMSQLIDFYGDVTVRVTSVPSGFGMGKLFDVRIPLALYKEYMDNNNADDPFYAFEHDLSGKRAELLKDFKVPSFFTKDLYELNSMTREFYPNYRHLIIGGQRTGTNLHIDPKCTSAWNTLTSGRKKWVMFPSTPHYLLKYYQQHQSDSHHGDNDDEREKHQRQIASDYLNKIGVTSHQKLPPTYWWLDIPPTIKEDLGVIECVQEAGETIFVPAGWWHAVLNLEDTIAITQNLLMEHTLPETFPELNYRWPQFAEYLKSLTPPETFDVMDKYPSPITTTLTSGGIYGDLLY